MRPARYGGVRGLHSAGDWYAQAEALFDVPPECFVPRPGVVSTVVQLTVRPAPPVAVEDRDFFFRVVRAAFGQRRKTLPNALCAGMPELSRPAVERAVAGLGWMAESGRGPVPGAVCLPGQRLICKLDK